MSGTSTDNGHPTPMYQSPPSVDLSNAPADIFRDHFHDPGRLFGEMALYCCFLSGSRAVDAFFPGTATENSDWDFIVPPNGNCIIGMIKALEREGVTFSHPLRYIDSLFHGSDSTSFHLSALEADTLVTSFDTWGDATFDGPRVFKIIEFFRRGSIESRVNPVCEPKTLKIPNGDAEVSITVYYDDPDLYDHLPGLNVIRGTGKLGKEVQLIYAPNINPTGHILRYHSTVVQCFVSPYGSGHMYYPLTASKLFWAWPANTVTGKGVRKTDRHAAALQKWSSRGWQVVERQAELTTRTMTDLCSRFVPCETPTFDESDLPAHTVNRRKELLKSLGWHETQDRTRAISNVLGVSDPKANRLASTTNQWIDSAIFCNRYALNPLLLSWTLPHDVTAL